MAAGACFDIADIPSNVGVSPRREVRDGGADTTGVYVDPDQRGRGLRTKHHNELARFIDIATGSASEVEYQLLLAKDLGYLPKDQHTDLSTEVIEIRRMLLAFNKTLRTNS